MKCVKDSFGTKRRYLNDKLHRVDGPAIEYPNGTKVWYFNGKLHRVDGPAIEWVKGTREWHLDLNGKPYRFGTKYWYLEGKLSRLDGPAIEHLSGRKYWYLDGDEIEGFEYFPLLKIRKFRSRITTSNNALGFNLTNILNLSRGKPVVEWYYSPDNGGGKLAKKRIEYVVSG